MDSTVLYNRWQKLHENPVPNDSYIALQGFYDCPFGSTYIGKDGVGNESLFVYLDEGSSRHFESPNISGLHFEIVCENKISSKETYLKISIQADHDNLCDAFEAFTVSLVERLSLIKESSTAIETLYDVCQDYGNFFGKGGKISLSFKEEEGLFGELLILNMLVDKFHDAAISCWMGPDRSRHDFVFQGNNAIEAKTSLKQNRKQISISNEMQLENPKDSALFLVLEILETNPAGETIADLINKVYGKLTSSVSKKKFDDKLMEMKVIRGKIVSNLRFILIESHHYKVDSEFPRLTISKVNLQSTRIYEVKYKIDLDGLEEYKGDIYELLRA
jgi:hypothetical protein